jgi:hypothetical protein
MRKREEPIEVVYLTNVTAELFEPFALGNRYALAHVDSLGVIEHLRFMDVAREAAQWSHRLLQNGVEPGDRVVVLAGRDREWRSALLGVLQAGGVAVPCRASAPVTELRAIAADAGAALFVSARARPDLVEPDGTRLLSADDLDPLDTPRAPSESSYMVLPGAVALILYERDPADLHGARHTHASLLAQAEAGAQWLGVGKGERVWCTAEDGSVESIWLLLAAWRAGAELVAVEQALEPESQLELLHRFQPAAVWFADDEYATLASAAEPAWAELTSIRLALASDERAYGVTAFEHAFGVKVAPVSAELGAGLAQVDEAAPDDLASIDAVAAPASAASDEPEAPSRQSVREERRARRREEQLAKELQRAEERSRHEEQKSRALAERAGAEERRRAEKAERAEHEAALAEEHRLAKEKDRAERKAALAEERRGAQEEKRREEERRRQANELQKTEERRRREEAKNQKRAERAAAEERRRAEKAERAEREAAVAEERLRAQELAERAAAEERRRATEAECAEREAAEQAELERLARETADSETERERLERVADEEIRQREAESPRELAHSMSDRGSDIVSRISEYGMSAQRVEREKRHDEEEPSNAPRVGEQNGRVTE